jgi:hypothetical protein
MDLVANMVNQPTNKSFLKDNILKNGVVEVFPNKLHLRD